MKIALTGSHGVGKSTLAKSLKNTLQQKEIASLVTPEVPRLICESVDDKEYFRRGNNSMMKQSLILIGQLITETEIDSKCKIQICDRTLFDHWAYSLSLFGNELREGNYVKIFEELIAKYCKSYDKIFYIPIEFAAIDDGIRESDEKFQQEIDSTLKDLFNKYNINFFEITGSVEERTSLILSTLNI